MSFYEVLVLPPVSPSPPFNYSANISWWDTLKLIVFLVVSKDSRLTVWTIKCRKYLANGRNYHVSLWRIYGTWAGRSLLRVMGKSIIIDGNIVMKVIHSHPPWFIRSAYEATPSTSWVIQRCPSLISLFINITCIIQKYVLLESTPSELWINIPPVCLQHH